MAVAKDAATVRCPPSHLWLAVPLVLTMALVMLSVGIGAGDFRFAALLGGALGYLGLDELAGRFLDQLSGGQRQRAFVAMVLCQDTDYVLLDEPLNNLDMRHAVEMMQLLQRAARELGRTLIGQRICVCYN